MARECLAARLRLVDRVVTGIYNDFLRPYGIRVTQINILGVVEMLDRPGPEEVCHILQMSPSTLSRNVKRLQKNGWITLKTGLDARTVRFDLSPRGASVLEEVRGPWEAAQKRVEKILGRSAVASIHALAERLRNGGKREGE